MMTPALHPDPNVRMLCESARELQLIARRMLTAEPRLAAPAYELALSTMVHAVVRDHDLLLAPTTGEPPTFPGL